MQRTQNLLSQGRQQRRCHERHTMEAQQSQSDVGNDSAAEKNFLYRPTATANSFARTFPDHVLDGRSFTGSSDSFTWILDGATPHPLTGRLVLKRSSVSAQPAVPSAAKYRSSAECGCGTTVRS
jgi:hypothetical protein